MISFWLYIGILFSFKVGEVICECRCLFGWWFLRIIDFRVNMIVSDRVVINKRIRVVIERLMVKFIGRVGVFVVGF